VSVGTRAFVALTVRELRRVARRPARVVSAVAAPALVLALLGSGLAGSYARGGAVGEGERYAVFITPGIAALTVMFGSVFAAIGLIEDRESGFLRACLVSPAPSRSIALSKLVATSVVATAQGAVILPVAWVLGGGWPGIGWVVASVGALALVSVSVAGVSLAAAWWSRDVSGFHGVMNLALMPMWLLSGSVFPADGAAGWMRAVMAVNPLRWSTDALRGSVSGVGAGGAAWVVAIVFAFAAIGLAVWSTAATRRRRRGL